ncbi:MAG: deoxynucleoside kinase [Bacteroidales bacterium]|nr:deoxynucleoside kinase [Bacteroidales bacterium]
MRYNYIVIEGSIGAGKTSLAKMIAKDYNAKLILERFEDNLFLPKFYKEPDRYAFPLELSFLADRYQQLKVELSSPELFKTFTIADYFIEKSYIFARKTLQGDEFILYSRLFEIINLSLPKPDLIIFLYTKVESLKQNILHRGREYEKDIENSYLEKIQSGYLDYFRQLKKTRILIINTEKIDFVKSNADYQKINNLINQDYPIGIHRITFN